MISRLPGWVWTGAALLAFVAGLINTVGFLGMHQEAITHTTGTATRAVITAAEGRPGLAAHLGGILLAFVAGAVLSGVIIPRNTLQLGQHYGTALLVESLLLAASIPLLTNGWPGGEYLASCACGLQNAMATSYAGAILRTTHLTGILTDIGLFLGHWLRGLGPDPRPFRLHLSVLGGFLAGGLAGVPLFLRFAHHALLVPAALTGLTGLGYALFLHWNRRR